MPPSSDGSTYTVGCRVDKLITSEVYLEAIREAITRVHTATFLATELANLHIRRLLRNGEADLDRLFTSNWLFNLYNEVTHGKGRPKVVPELRQTRDQCMPSFRAPSRTGILQCLLYECRNLAAVAATNIWKHFSKRVLAHVRLAFQIDEMVYKALSANEKKQRTLRMLQIATDLQKSPQLELSSPPEYHEWIRTERERLGIDFSVGAWDDKPLLYHLKEHPGRFVRATALMSRDRETAGKRAYALFPLRRHYTPRHVRFDQAALRKLLHLGGSSYSKQTLKAQRAAKAQTHRTSQAEDDNDDLGLPPLCACASDDLQPLLTEEPIDTSDTAPLDVDIALKKKRKRRSRDEMCDEKNELFARVVNLRQAGVKRRHHFDYAFTTDGVCARVQMRNPSRAVTNSEPTAMPTRGIWAIDEIKHLSRLEALHVVGVDPGKREIVVGVDMDAPRSSPVRYTQRQRQFDRRIKQYSRDGARDKPDAVRQTEREMAGYVSRSACLDTFKAFCTKRRERFDECLAFYGQMDHRCRRWKSALKAQQSEGRLYSRIRGLKTDERPLVLAYGSWGLVAGRSDLPCNRGNPPTIGVGMMRKLAKRFVVVPTPEAYTSKTCCRCLGPCGAWASVEEARGRKIRGLRLCQTETCKLSLNRDRNGATNIGTTFKRLFEGMGPIRTMSDADRRMHQLRVALESD